MSTSQKLIYELCQGDQPCMVDFDKLYEEGYNQNNSSTTHLGGLSGAVSDVGRDDVENLYGAFFKPVKYHTPYYSSMEMHTIHTPWLAAYKEHTFMNRIKELNEEPVLTYKELQISPVPTDKYVEYVPTIYKVEGFGPNKLQFNKLTTLIVVVFFIIVICFILNKI